MDENSKCGNCLYWKRKGNTMSGKCHRHAPRRIPSKDSGYFNDWAVTNEDDFCGDFGSGTPKMDKAGKSPESVLEKITLPKDLGR